MTMLILTACRRPRFARDGESGPHGAPMKTWDWLCTFTSVINSSSFCRHCVNVLLCNSYYLLHYYCRILHITFQNHTGLVTYPSSNCFHLASSFAWCSQPLSKRGLILGKGLVWCSWSHKYCLMSSVQRILGLPIFRFLKTLICGDGSHVKARIIQQSCPIVAILPAHLHFLCLCKCTQSLICKFCILCSASCVHLWIHSCQGSNSSSEGSSGCCMFDW